MRRRYGRAQRCAAGSRWPPPARRRGFRIVWTPCGCGWPTVTYPQASRAIGSDVEVELELVRVRAEPDRVEFAGSLVVQPGLDQVWGEHPAVEQVVVVGFQGVEHL